MNRIPRANVPPKRQAPKIEEIGVVFVTGF
jgi:hypothetical protein